MTKTSNSAPRFVIDASVVIKWFSSENEELYEEALKLLGRIKNGSLIAYSPEFVLIEASNVACNKKHFSDKEVGKMIDGLTSLGINFVPLLRSDIKEINKIMFKY